MKDKYAKTTQSFSLLFESQPEPDEVVELVDEYLPVTVNWAKYHDNKLRSGHLRGNKFSIIVTEPEHPEAYKQACLIADTIHEYGLPNFYGIQRTGEQGENIIQGWKILKKQKRLKNRWLRRYLVSSYQSYLCNQYLTKRVKENLFSTLLWGDIAKKHDTGGLFWVDDLTAEQRRFDNKEISYTAPMFGYKMSQPKDKSFVFETGIHEESEITNQDYRDSKIKGTRRMGRILPEINVKQVVEGILLEFMLPKGSFATILLREFMKNDVFAD